MNPGEHGKFYGKFMGHVRNVTDPNNRGRLRAFVPEVMGMSDDADHWTDWALPCFPAFAMLGVGGLLIPPVGDEWGVWIEFRQGNVCFPIWTGVFPIKASIADATQATLTSPQLFLGGAASTDPSLGDGLVVAAGVDPFTGATYGQLGNASVIVFAKKS